MPPGLLPVAPSRAAVPARSPKAPDVVHRLATDCGQNHPGRNIGLVPIRQSGGLVPSGDSGSRRWPARSPMKGTSGAADLDLLRGRAGDAALGLRCVPVNGACANGLRAGGSSRAHENLPFAGVVLVRWNRYWRLSLTGAAPGSAGVSTRRCRGSTTRGVRADRVGVRLASRVTARKGERAAPRRIGGESTPAPDP
jgi:hypothetical protein